MHVKDGFYLSPLGKSIIEVNIVAMNSFCQSFDVNFDGHVVSCDGSDHWFLILLEGWEFLE